MVYEDQYIFHIGMGGTGSSSLHKALNILGIPCSHHYKGIDKSIYDTWNKDLKKNIKPDLGMVEYKAFTDHIIFRKYFILFDIFFPQSKFIFTVRELNSWLDNKDYYFFIKSGYHIDIDEFIQRYNTNTSNILTYFQDKPNKLLTMNIIDGDGYDKLCPFLNLPLLDQPFPHEKDRRIWKPEQENSL